MSLSNEERQNKENNKQKGKEKNKTRDFFDSLIIAFVIAMIIRTFLISAYKIPSESMLNTLLVGDHILASKISYIIGKPKFGDLAVFEYPLEPDKDFIKRVIGTPGDRIKISGQNIFRNGVLLDETYAIKSKTYGAYMEDTEFTVPEGMYLMLGDNRDNSYDSRFWGFVPEKSFKGKAQIIYFSKSPSDGIRWDRIFKRTK